MSFVYKADPVRGAEWAEFFARKMPDMPFHIWPDVGDARDVRYLAAWQPPANLMTDFPNLEVLFCTGAGIDHLDLSVVPDAIPIVRMVETGIVSGMVEYVTLAVLSIHRDWKTYLEQQRERDWTAHRVRPASSRRVGVLGLGSLGRAVLPRLQSFGFSCAGWSRFPQQMDGVDCYAGADEMGAFLKRTDILICLVPLTDSTRGILDKRLFDALPRGAAVINVGRGGHLVQDDLLQALNDGTLSYAVVDVCEPEPLPRHHPFWTHPKVTLTPHIASMTQPETAVEAVVANIRRLKEGSPMIGLVDSARGY
ncbi:glyoxylate/hydroxypyruvate reductase A [Paraburkholderia phenazinium]|uniref:Glyoxylate/hydroxypyruvate reductase A n=1 Tax=Paraburkholderia phenazinium TaxID=60549 RepID=A0A1G7U3Z0_9BURK|nr:glyoxylate/hydroxypyruvate reductase A [Paraburkholderia phenazinium]SDG42124.1 glyoxylate/hydroxypyruvate reductase A [Paraburkholderia phenazinium]